MGVGNRPAACASCGKRLGQKKWYYRNGKTYCTRGCWKTDSEKAAAEKAAKGNEQAAPATEAPAASAPAEAPKEAAAKTSK